MARTKAAGPRFLHQGDKKDPLAAQRGSPWEVGARAGLSRVRKGFGILEALSAWGGHRDG